MTVFVHDGVNSGHTEVACSWDENDDVIQQKACTHNPTRQLKRAEMKDDYQYGDRKIQKAVMQCWERYI